MSDAAVRKRARQAVAEGVAPPVEDQIRTAGGVIGVLATFCGQWVYAETWKMNYRGVLKDVTTEPTGAVVLLLDPCYRVGEWQDGPDEATEEKMETTPAHPRLMRWEGVAEFGLIQAHWPKSGPPAGPKNRR